MTTELNPHLQDWLTALRSGAYVQARRAMLVRTPREDGEYDDAYCCLGVACHLADVPFHPSYAPEGVTYERFGVQLHEGLTQSKFLPQWLGLLLDLSPEEQVILTDMNDGGRSFDLIADIIELSRRDGVPLFRAPPSHAEDAS